MKQEGRSCKTGRAEPTKGLVERKKGKGKREKGKGSNPSDELDVLPALEG